MDDKFDKVHRALVAAREGIIIVWAMLRLTSIGIEYALNVKKNKMASK